MRRRPHRPARASHVLPPAPRPRAEVAAAWDASGSTRPMGRTTGQTRRYSKALTPPAPPRLTSRASSVAAGRDGHVEGAARIHGAQVVDELDVHDAGQVVA